MVFKPPPPRCQCDPNCKIPPLEGKSFCKIHNGKCKRMTPETNSEPVFEPEEYNQNADLTRINNCYAYATGYRRMPKECTKKSECNAPFPQPGLSSGHPPWSKVNGKRCPDVLARALGDIPGSYLARFTQKCRPGMRKIAFLVDPKRDYHVVRVDKKRVHPKMKDNPPAGYMSHKSGSTMVKDVDATGRPIYDALLAKFYTDDGELNYIHPCSYMCIPANKEPPLTRGSSRKFKRKSYKRTRKVRRASRN